MGGAVSSGESNDDLVDNLMAGEYVKTPLVETVFRAVDRAFYFTKPFKHNAYKDLAWKDGNLHISAPCIYSEVMENLELRPGMSFLNIGAGTGYLSTMIGLVLGRYGTNHGIEIYSNVVDYASAKLKAFLRTSPAIDMFDFCEPNFVVGNCMDLMPTEQKYDRIYCGAACPSEDVQIITDLLKVGGICIIPMNDSLVQIKRVSETKVEMKTLLPVTFATLVPSWVGNDPSKKSISLPRWNPPKLSELCRSEIRELLRRTIAPPETKVPEVETAEESRKRRRKRKAERRRASRLLVVQRRRNGENREGRGNNNGIVAIAYSMGDHTTSSDDENPLARRHLPQNRYWRERASSVGNITTTTTPSSGEKRSSSTQAAETNASNTDKMEEDSTQASSSAKVARKDETSTSATSRPSRVRTGPASDLASTVFNNLARNMEEAPRRRARTESILARIREIIQNRQVEREALRLAQAQRDLQLQREVDEALREPPNGQDEESPEILNNDDEIDHECVWTSDDSSSSSSSTSTTSSSDTDCLADNLSGQEVAMENRCAESGEDDRPARFGNRPLPLQLPIRRHRLISADSETSDDSMDHFPPIADALNRERERREQSPRVNNALKEIEAIEEEGNQPAVVMHPFSIGLMQKIDALSLPVPIKKYLNYQRNFC